MAAAGRYRRADFNQSGHVQSAAVPDSGRRNDLPVDPGERISAGSADASEGADLPGRLCLHCAVCGDGDLQRHQQAAIRRQDEALDPPNLRLAPAILLRSPRQHCGRRRLCRAGS